ncbi:MAG: hypothetical protein IPO93_12375 [Actinobacteria bacterium]|jgi:sugar (pentulose or hexulose) kinase|nr:hypothetical protein [Actinomycetota bacterium]
MISTSAREIVLGIDVGTTSMKGVALTLDGEVVGTASSLTRWDAGHAGQVEMPIDRLADAAIAVLLDLATSAGDGHPVIGIGITGLAETGVVLDAEGRPVTPAIAWYDQRGADELAALPPEFLAEFSAVTGLAAKAECSFAKLLWLRRQGLEVPSGGRWLNALEYIAFRLTGVQGTEPSLASRTGLLDQASVGPWNGALGRLGLRADFLPELVPAGTSLGEVAGDAPLALRGAAVTVAGHDHLVNSVGAGAVGGDDLFDSCGTADVILRTVPRTLTNDERSSLVARGLSAGRHCLPGSTAILGATRSGLVLGRVLSMLGAKSLGARRHVANAWQPTDVRGTNVLVSEPPGWTNEVTIRLREYATPDEVWAAAMAYVLDQTADLLSAIADIAGPYEHAVAAGGWAQLHGVLRGKAQLMPGITVSEVAQPGAHGAAHFAAQAAGAARAVVAQRESTTVSTQHTEELVT